ncbi:MAG TPA: hypothetical protein VGB13_08425 [Candidatus Krumholzibacteria bacterium]|jgi:hypothetical protein
MIRRLSFLLLSLLFCFAAGAQNQPNPCEADARYHQFDFWLGEWEVFSADGKKQGENSITAAESECMLLEQWTSSQGGTGQSYNFLDPHSGEWNQVWISKGSIIRISGGLEGEAMTLVGEIVYYASGQRARFRGRWTPKEDGTVEQFFEQYDSEKAAWNTWFLGIYQRKSGE